MPPITVPVDECSRLKALRAYQVLDTLPEQALDDLTALAATICDVPIAMISLVDEHREWFKSRIGTAAAETPRGISFSTHALGQRDLLIVPDATQDARFAKSPLVSRVPGVRFYAGAPLVTPEGAAIGALSVSDRVPRTLTPMQQEALRVLAGQVMTHLELRRHKRDLVESEERLRVLTDSARVGLVIVNRERHYAYANDAYAEILGLPSSAIAGQRVADVLAGIYEEQIRPRLDRAFAGERVAYELHKPSADGDRHYAVRYEPTEADGEVAQVVMVLTDITERRQAEEGRHEAARFAQSTIDALSSHVCVLDENGTILATNEAWRRFAEANPPVTKRADTGDNYLLVCDSSVGAEAAEAAAFAAGIHAVLQDECAEFTMEYPCHSPSEQRWFVGRVTRFPGGDPVRLVVAHANITERKLAEAVSLRLAAIVESSDDAIIGEDLNGVITSWNRGAEKIFGYTPGEMTGTSIMRLIPADRQHEAEHILGKIRRGESVKHFETLRLTKGGRVIHVSVTASPIRGADGRILGASKVARDITARKQAEETQRASDGRYRALFENAPDGIVIADAESTYLDANASICRMLGYPRDELIGKHASDIVVPAEVRHIEPALNALRDNADYHREWKFRRKDGSVFDAEVIATMMPDGNLLGMIRDITERKRAEDQIAEQAAFLDKAQDAILVRNLEGEILFWNQGAERMYGWTRQEVTCRNIGDLLYGDPGIFEEANGLTISQGEWHGELQHFTKHRGEITVEARWTLIRDDEGRPKSVLAINTDITERKKIEAQFMRAQRMESIGTLAGGIAHDLNNVLAPIMLSLEVLKMKFPDPDSLHLLDILATSAQHGSDMVRQVLSFARGVEGRRMEVQIKHLVEGIEKFANDTFLKNVQVQTIIPHDLWTVLGDPTQLHQVLLNLCVNARDAMPDGGVLTVSAENLTLDAHYAGMNLEARPGSYILIQVEDTGTGMPPGVIEKIFDPFFTTKDLGKGTGLGLSTSLAIVKSHGGFFQVYSEMGKGTKFRVYFPAQTGASAETAAEIAAELPRGNGELILVVDDELSVRLITQQTLQAFGYRVMLASDGAEAVAAYARQSSEIAAVLTDMMMPVMDGPATIQVLRKLNPAVRIIAASGLSSNGHTTGLGVKHFLPKPYTAGTLLKALKEIIEEEP